MKKIISLIMCVVLLFIIGCSDNLVVGNGLQTKIYKPYGIFNEDKVKDDKVEYKICWGNVFWAVVLSETIIVPLYVLAVSLYEPISLKGEK